jgi:hypothetical protein
MTTRPRARQKASVVPDQAVMRPAKRAKKLEEGDAEVGGVEIMDGKWKVPEHALELAIGTKKERNGKIFG